MKINIGMGVALVTASALLGCKETTSSEFIRTGGIAALIGVTAESDESSKVHVELRVGGDESNTYVILQGGDKLSATAGTETHDLSAVTDGVYEGTFATGKATEFTIALDRTEDEDAFDNKGTLPEPFSITAPTTDKELSRAGDSIPVEWSNTVLNSEGTIEVSGDCIFTETYTVSGAATTFSIPKADLRNADDMKPESCTVTVQMTFKGQGSTDLAFDDESYFFTYQKRSTTFTSNP